MNRVLRVLIADADASQRQVLRQRLADLAPIFSVRVVGEVSDGVAALELMSMSREPVDVLLVEPDMPLMGGIELARHLAGRDGRPAVVFVCRPDAERVAAMRGLELDVLEKPVSLDALRSALLAARKLPAQASETLRDVQRGPRRYLSALERGKIRLVAVEEVIYLRAELKYVTARTASREYLLDASLTQLEQEFSQRFLRVHRNCLVSRKWMAGFERSHDAHGEPHWLVRLRGVSERLPVSRRQWPVVRGAVGAGAPSL